MARVPRKRAITFGNAIRLEFFTKGTSYSQAVGVQSAGLCATHNARQDLGDVIDLLISRLAPKRETDERPG